MYHGGTRKTLVFQMHADNRTDTPECPRRGRLQGADARFHLAPQVIGVHWLHEMAIEACVSRSDAIEWETITGERDQPDTPAAFIGAEPPRQFVAVDAGQPDVDDRHFRRNTPKQIQGGGP